MYSNEYSYNIHLNVPITKKTINYILMQDIFIYSNTRLGTLLYVFIDIGINIDDLAGSI